MRLRARASESFRAAHERYHRKRQVSYAPRDPSLPGFCTSPIKRLMSLPTL